MVRDFPDDKIEGAGLLWGPWKILSLEFSMPRSENATFALPAAFEHLCA